MNCSRIMKYLYLFREGELTRKQERKLEGHLEQCTACSMLRHRLECMDAERFEPVRQADLRPADPEGWTESIVQGVSARDMGRSFPCEKYKRKKTAIPLRMRDPFRRTVPVTAFLLLLLTFLAQEVRVARRVAVLEKQVAASSGYSRETSDLQKLRDRFIGRFPLSVDANRIREEIQDVIDLNEEWVLIRKERLSEILTDPGMIEMGAGLYDQMTGHGDLIRRIIDALDNEDAVSVRTLFDSEHAIRRFLRML